MINELSILIPVYNDSAVALVSVLHSQAEAIDGLEYEILAIDDGSTNEAVIAENRAIDGLSHCCYVIDRHHDCRAAMRNNMTSKGKYEWHLMVDARLSLSTTTSAALSQQRSAARRGRVRRRVC